MIGELSRRGFIGTMAATTSATLVSTPAYAAIPREHFVEQLRSKLGLTGANAEAMAVRAHRLLKSPAALLVGDRTGSTVEVIEWTSRQREWMLRAPHGCDMVLADAVGLGCSGATALIAGGGASLRWFSSCSFGGAAGHLLRHARGTVFLVTSPYGRVPPKRVDIV